MFCLSLVLKTVVLAAPLFMAKTNQAYGDKAMQCHRRPNHSKIHTQELGSWSIWYSSAPRARYTREENLSIHESNLEAFCQAYIAKAMGNIEEQKYYEIQPIVMSYVEIYGNESIDPLRALLASSKLACISAGSYHLGQIGDRESIPMLKSLLAAKHLQLPAPTFNCPNHMDDVFKLPGRCPKCRVELFESMPQTVLLGARDAIAGALYVMGAQAGIGALKEILKKQYGGFIYHTLTLRDSKEARQLLEAGTRDQLEYKRAQAVEGLLWLGDIRYIEQAVKFLMSHDEAVRYSAVNGLAKVNDSTKSQRALSEFLNRNDVWPYEKLAAAQALVSAGKKEYLKLIIDTCASVSGDTDESAAILALGEVGDEDILPLLKTVIENNTRNRLWAVIAAIKILRRGETLQ